MDDENNVEKPALEDDTLDVSEEDEDVDDETAEDAMERGECDKCNDVGQEDGTQPKKHIPRSQKKKIARMKKKERLKELRKQKKEMKRQGATKTNSAEDDSAPRVSKRQRLQEIRERLDQALKTGQRIAIDLSMEHLMSEKECSKLAQQINRMYGANKQLTHPAHIYLTGIKMDGILPRELHSKCSGFENYKIDVCAESHLELFKPNEIVYLSPDSDKVLQSVDADKVYILGGLVDEHIQKDVTHSRAESARIFSARLPINEYLTKSQQGTYKTVLAINQVFDILMKYTECQDWTESLQTGMAKRWGYVPKLGGDSVEGDSPAPEIQSLVPSSS